MKAVKKLKYYLIKFVLSKVQAKYKVNLNNKGIINFIDIGSVGGLPQPWLSNANKVKYLVNFEPNESIKETRNSITFNSALWSSDEELDFYIYKGFRGTGSSLFQQNFEYVNENFEKLKQSGDKKLANSWHERSELVKTLKIRTTTLDGILSKSIIDKRFHFIKIDAQGAELEILKGAENTLDKCLGLHLELFTIPLYKNIPLLSEVENYLSSKNFKLVKKFDSHGSFNSQNDCLFIKQTSQNEFLINEIKKVYNL